MPSPVPAIQPDDSLSDSAALALLNQRIDFFAVLQEVDAELNHALELNSVLQIALHAAQIVSRAQSGCIALLDDNGEVTLSRGFGGYTELPLLPEIGVPARALRQASAEYVPDVSLDAEYAAVIPSTRAQMVLPLLAHHKIIGLLNMETDAPDDFTPQVFEFTSLLAARSASATENARLYEQSQRQLGELQRLYHELSALEQLKTDMIRVVAHDVRSPLAIIYSYMDLLNQDLEPCMTEHHRNAVRTIRKSVGRIDRMSADILAVERLETDTSLPEDIVALGMVLQTAVDEHYDECRDKNQQLTLSIPADPVYVTGDQGQLREAINNLLDNAIKYTPERGRISARLLITEGYGQIEIEDNGFGVPDGEQARLFEPFSRIKMSEARGIEGNGLGLYLVRKIVARHRGDLVWNSVYKVGSIFGFRIPLYQ